MSLAFTSLGCTTESQWLLIVDNSCNSADTLDVNARVELIGVDEFLKEWLFWRLRVEIPAVIFEVLEVSFYLPRVRLAEIFFSRAQITNGYF